MDLFLELNRIFWRGFCADGFHPVLELMRFSYQFTDYSIECAILNVMLKKKHLIVLVLLGLFFYTRFVGIGWGLPYPMHPDERNMANAIQELRCPTGSALKDCYNPHFFAYGQFPLYVAYAIAKIWLYLRASAQESIGFVDATLALRLISAIASVLNLYFLIRIVHILRGEHRFNLRITVVSMLLFTFVPYSIQFAHFGTTESLLMALYTGIIYYSLQLFDEKKAEKALLYASILCGCAVATKISSLLFIGVPIAAILRSKSHTKILSLGTFILFTTMCAALFSPHNVISFEDFRGAMTYEIGIGQGKVVAFYNRQFDNTLPVIFQLTRVFPYVLGKIQYLIAAVALFLLPYSKKNNLIRFSFFIFFLPTAFLYAKWTRFIAPVLPVLTIFVAVTFLTITEKFKWKILYFIFFLALLPGIAYVSIYQREDVRIQASRWIVKNIPSNSKILSETANVVDIPIYYPGITPFPNYDVVSFDFYQIDKDSQLVDSLQKNITSADYIFIPSRRIFANNTCFRFQDKDIVLRTYPFSMLLQGYGVDNCEYLSHTYPKLVAYYSQLFSHTLPFVQIAEINSYPRISIFGKTLYEIRDEQAEETWTVFDHPVIRIYKRI